MTEAGTDSIRVEIGDDRIATLTIDVPGQAANTMSTGFKAELCELVPRLRAMRSELAGVVVTSAKKTFFAGGDLRALLAVQPADAPGFFEGLERFKASLRGLEQLGLPVAVAINGAALGGGWEICLCAHARFCLADDKLLLGLPEASLGLLPGAGGVTRMVRLLGLGKALPLLLEGRTFAPAQALAWGLLDGTGSGMPSVIAQARAWVLANPDPKVPWDDAGFAIPGLDADLQDIASNGPADLLASGHGLYPARQAVLAAAVEGAVVDLDTALRLESRYLASLATGQVAKNMIGTFFFQAGQVKAGRSRPAETERVATAAIDVEGASAPLLVAALVSASRRVPAVVQARTAQAPCDVEQALDAIVRGLVTAGRMPQARAAAARAAVQVMEVPAASALRLVDAPLGDAASGVLLLADPDAVVPAGWVGVRALPDLLGASVVEVVRGSRCDAAHAARVYDWLQQLGKTPITVSDAGPGLLARLGRAAGAEALALCREGLPPELVENASLQAGMAAGALALAHRFGLGAPPEARSGEQLPQPLDQLRAAQERLLFIQALEALRCLDEGIVGSARDANLAALQGLGFPAWTGGAIQYANQYGLKRFCERSDALAARHGERFEPSPLLRRLVADGALAVEP